MKTVLLINGGKVTSEIMSPRFQTRLKWAIDYYRQHAESEGIAFFVSGRWDNVTENYSKTEAELGKLYIQHELPDAVVYKEDVSVELIGNYAFSKPLLQSLHPDKVIIVTSEFLRNRTEAICRKVFAGDITYQLEFLTDELTGDPTIVDKEANALTLFNNIFGAVGDGDDSAVRDILLYQTPYYFKGIIDDREYFDKYWPGGYEHFLHGITFRNAQAAKS